MARLGHRGGTFVLLLAAAVIALLIPAAPAEAAGLCATPGRDGSASLTGIVNTYYPGLGTATAGSTTITLGPATGASTPIAIGDLLLVVQMQDAAINSATPARTVTPSPGIRRPAGRRSTVRAFTSMRWPVARCR